MDLNTQFIYNLNKISSSSNRKITIGNWSQNAIVYNACKIYPGIIATTDKASYVIKDRNLKENCSYKPEVTIGPNNDKLSFSRIRLTVSMSYRTNTPGVFGPTVPYNKPYVSQVEADGEISDVLKFPLDVAIVDGAGTFTTYGNLFIDGVFNPCIDSTHRNTAIECFYYLSNYILKNDSNRDFILTCIKSDTVNPYDSSLSVNALDVLFKAWGTWTTYKSTVTDKAARGKEYKTAGITTFKDFLNKLFAGTDYGVSFSANEKEALKRFIKLTKNNLDISTYYKYDGSIRIAPNGLNESIYNVERSNKIIRSFACFVPNYSPTNYKPDSLIPFHTYSPIEEIELIAYYKNAATTLYISYISDDPNQSNSLIANVATDIRTAYSKLILDKLYPVVVISNRIHYDSITIIQNNDLYLYKKALSAGLESFSIYDLQAVIINANPSTEIESLLDATVENVEYITPSEYYGNIISSGNFTEGNEGYSTIRSDGDTDVPSWFWSDTLANWCIFRQYRGKNVYKLYVWNGRNAWDCFDDIVKHPSNYLYDFTNMKFGINFSCLYQCDSMPINYSVVILKYDNNFSQYNNNNFQTLRIGKIWSDNRKTKRYPYTIGIPPIMRLSSGEIGLLYTLSIPGVNEDHPVIFPENVKFLNSICRAFFGDGEDKTIKDDWKRVDKKNMKEDLPGVIVSSKESSLVDADEINTVKDSTSPACIEFTPFKQYIETDNIDTEAYVERWN